MTVERWSIHYRLRFDNDRVIEYVGDGQDFSCFFDQPVMDIDR